MKSFIIYIMILISTTAVPMMEEALQPPELVLESEYNCPGNILVLSVENPPVNSEITMATDISHGLLSEGLIDGAYYFFIPIDIWEEAGAYSVDVSVDDLNLGRHYDLSSEIMLTDWDFKIQYLYVSDEVYESTNNDDAYREFRERVQTARGNSDKEKYWEGKFILPFDDFTLTTDFGEKRFVNDQLTSTRHSGLDLAAPTGTEIHACNNGRVALAEYVTLTGNTLVIDHGMGLFTSYYHMDTIDVEKGDFLEKGDYVGTVGSTGFSTGPHLHWSISIYNTYVNTHQVLDGELFKSQ
ncbi:Murein DD-endopeptidase MepM and murein hydrolase activator NlpD, contain LysM domain [Dethiosulfatibacter aminovorans DSM 17477]|uniref:Murein DD-endopeptidase MepM and murein hydrolase activator NlpD, contain LysM domain n=1 Tax=Dethiosulfatibacter aminovorans DSM 17477 TaxID=1121476 RepID=A0A1M6JDL5_9FIRM|nr:M23 family metallopeptidase [Dethiosulfatibacter aminovorans]SHJ44763.1 Murein DD-endopeptidase MepM and murein hydrolase activator NlpD, contain LysM domain [Dethiosulfatibacter aminovorans DSM 17477]